MPWKRSLCLTVAEGLRSVSERRESPAESLRRIAERFEAQGQLKLAMEAHAAAARAEALRSGAASGDEANATWLGLMSKTIREAG